MRVTREFIPTTAALVRALGAVLGNGGSTAVVRITTRTPNPWASYYHSEVVECSRSDGSAYRLLIKYGARARREHTQRLGTAYEAVVYREVLQRLPMTTVKYYGTYTTRRASETWLVMDHMAGAAHSDRGSTQREGMIAAATWIARFHARTRRRAPRLDEILNRYDARYCRLWANRTLRFESSLNAPWLEQLVREFETAVSVLTSAPQTIVHGDYYADNVLYDRGEAYPIDWERAGVGPGEIDLACLTNGWHAETIEECERAYSEARWPQGAPRAFKRRFNAAQLYVLFRLLGEAPGWPDLEMRTWRLDLLRAAGERMGLIEPRC